MKGIKYHQPVLVKEVLELLHIKNLGKYVDATVGAGGHTREIIAKGGIVLGLDTDPTMLEVAKEELSDTCPELVHANFRDIKELASQKDFVPCDGVLFDLGVSSVHFDDLSRGFSFKNPEAPLDMRLDTLSQGVKASDLINSLNSNQLTELFELGMESYEAKKLSKQVLFYRESNEIETVGDFLKAGRFFKRPGKVHPATKAFMALRIAVNSEFENLKIGLAQAFEILNTNGRLVVISFHSGEDRIVKNYFLELVGSSKAKLVTKKAIKPSVEEIETNPRSRSAVLRGIEKI